MKILIVDDNVDNIDMMTILLESQNYKVEAATNGKEALEKLKDDTFDLIISDILMPVMDGFQLCTECKKDEKLMNIRFIFYTATYLDKKDEELAYSIGAQEFLRKPQEPEVFINKINEILKTDKVQNNKTPLSEKEEAGVLKLYSERLINKLEKRNMDLEAEVERRKNIENELQSYKEQLEEQVKKRTKELEEKNLTLEKTNEDLERMNKLFVDREFRIKELKDKLLQMEEKNKDR